MTLLRAFDLSGPFDTFDGLPVHALVLHAVVVLLPLSCAGVVAIAIWPAWRERYGVLVALVTTAATASVPVAVQSGQFFRDALNIPAEGFRHGELGETLPFFAIPFWLLTVALVLLHRRGVGRTAVTVVAALAVIAAGATAIQTIRIGDAGSRAVWEGVVTD